MRLSILLELILFFFIFEKLTLIDTLYILNIFYILVLSYIRSEYKKIDKNILVTIIILYSLYYPYLIYFSADLAKLNTKFSSDIYTSAIYMNIAYVFVISGFILSIMSTLFLNKSFGIRPALRDIKQNGTYAIVRHPLYLSYILSDIGLLIVKFNMLMFGIIFLGWLSFLFRIHREEHLLALSNEWLHYTRNVPYKLFPKIY